MIRVSAFLVALLSTTAATAQETRYLGNEQIDAVERTVLEQIATVNATSLNFRGDPSIGNPPIGLLREAEPVLILEQTFNSSENRRWSRVRKRDGSEGWAAAQYLEPIDAALATLDAAIELAAALGVTTAADLGAPAAAIASARKLDEIHAGFVFSAPIGDAGWTFSHNAARLAIEAMPFVAETSYIESVPEDPALVAAAIDSLVEDGANLIFGTSFGYMDSMVEAARRHPDVTFMHSGGFKTAQNMDNFFGRIYQARYLSGIVAGHATRTNKLGFVGAFPISQLIRGINAFTLGARSVNPEAEVEVIWTGTWFGPGIEAEAADQLIANGADVITMHQNSPAALQAAEKAGVMGIGFHSDMSLFAPNAALTSAAWNWEPIYRKAVTDLFEGAWQPTQKWWGIDEGAVTLAPLNKSLPASLTGEIDAARSALADGSLHIFEGPIRGQDGSIVVPSGKLLSDAELLQMDFFVRGVSGSLPEKEAPSGDDN